jgi:hypothetical protein
MPIAIASGCAPEQERDILTKSPVLFEAPRPRSPLACSPSQTLVVFVPAQNNPRRRPPKPHERFVRDAEIPIDRATQPAPNLPAVSSLGGFRTPAPQPARPPAKGPASETLHQLRHRLSGAKHLI